MNLAKADPAPVKQTDLFQRISWRLIPLLFLAYVVSYVDFYNIAFAQLQMKEDLGMSDSLYGLGASLMVIGQVLFMIPSNLLLHRYGARLTIIRVMLAWFFGSVALAFVVSPFGFIAVRFVTGVFSSGFFTGLILYLTYWYPAAHRARIMAVFLLAPVVAGVFVGPFSGWIISTFDEVAGLRGWQWMFIIEALPALIIAAFIPWVLADRPDEVSWLTWEEKKTLAVELAQVETVVTGNGVDTLRDLLRDPRVYLLGLVSALVTFGVFAASFFLPLLIRDLGLHDIKVIGLASSLPYLFGGAFMLFWTRRSDRLLERRWHVAWPLIGAAAGFAVLSLQPPLAVGLAALTMIVAGLLAAIPCFWPIPPSFMSGSAAAAGIALIVVIGDLGGALAPPLVGKLRSAGLETVSLLLCAGLLCVAAALLLFVTRHTVALRPADRA